MLEVISLLFDYVELCFCTFLVKFLEAGFHSKKGAIFWIPDSWQKLKEQLLLKKKKQQKQNKKNRFPFYIQGLDKDLASESFSGLMH